MSLAQSADARGLFGGGRIVLKEGRLADALRDLSVRSGSDLLFNPDVVGNLRNKRVAGTLAVEPILASLLEGTGLGYRRVGDGTYIVFRLEPEQPTALPEILVVGRKTQNADIRRTENDIQAYRVATAEDIRSSHADNLDQFLRTRQPSNAERQGPSSEPGSQYASNRSEVNLHGLGSNQTLVLVDGARMPSVLSQLYDLETRQPDLNGLPLLAIDRVESLTGTAGGIYGPGATGGVVNVILKRDYRGAEISATYGLTERGDGERRRIDGRIGFSPDEGRTDVMINVSRAESDGLRAGDRAFGERARALRIARNVTDYAQSFQIVDGVLARSLFGDPLTLSPALGGASLGSTFTYLPIGGSGAGDGSVLLSNAGQLPSTLSPDGNGARRGLVSATTVSSLLLNARHRFGDRVEVFVDFIGFENEGRSEIGYFGTASYTGLTTVMQREDGVAVTDNYPLQQAVILTFPLPGFDAAVRNRLRTTRLSAGAIVRLPGAWRAEATYSDGVTRNRVRANGYALNSNFSSALSERTLGAAGEPMPDPFGPWEAFAAALQAYKVQDDSRVERKSYLRDFSVRLGGPLLRREAGDVALSLLAERREEHATLTAWEYTPGTPRSTLSDPSFSLSVSSLYGELRAPLVSRGSSLSPLRGLELQLAARYDDNQAEIPGNAYPSLGTPLLRYRRAGAVYTAGLRVFPMDHLLVRASVATGVLPPTPEQMVPSRYSLSLPKNYVFDYYRDPQRGGVTVGSEKPVVILGRGSTGLRPEKARTLAIGFVANPDGGRWPRISLDYTHTEKRDEISQTYNGNLAYFLANESLYPGRITRDALSSADIAAGYSGGVVTQIDATYLNVGKTDSDAVDLNLDHAVRLGQDRLRFYGGLTWTPRLKRQAAPDKPKLDYVGTDDGPLRWRGAAGAAWDHGDLTIGLNAQYYDDYYAIGAFASAAEKSAADLPGLRIPAQVYFDATATYRLEVTDWRGLARDIEIRFGVQNLLDHDPPTVNDIDLGYSLYGDPRGRRFELSATARF
ncbi:TonB-dependent receptor [Caulobacter hibisci]|uniref:TonB-dependent receptor n=1 Tax=Caulobacter hibisci TaxID=2035993 RepID=A0ABS0T144_9CAUL|nr:TonB-dependent receptor [Caulobacter hibisci]MBI1685585.1 TonB-dependent receptor [Caulobacter hibisci]